MKEHKMQIIAALALAFSLGLTMPAFTYASEGDDTEVATQAEGAEDAGEQASTAGGTNKEDVISQDVSENIVELVSRINDRASFAGFRKAQGYVYAAEVVAEYTTNAETYLKKQVSEVDDKTYWEHLSADTKEAVKDKDAYEALTYIKEANGADYTALKARTDRILGVAANDMTVLKNEMAVLTPDVDTSTLDTPAKLYTEAAKLPSFKKYVDLFDALTFVRGTTVSAGLTCGAPEEGDGGDEEEERVTPQAESDDTRKGYLVYCEAISEDLDKALDEDYKEEELFLLYNNLARAAIAIDDTVMEGLMDWKMPTTSAPEAPDAGIIGLIESGALDLGTITLIVSVALASVAGLSLIAKLYLKHKF